MTKSRCIRWLGHIAHIGEMRNTYKILFRRSEGKRLLGVSGIGGRIMLKWTLSVDWIM
jgi:hypothetical protein